MTHVKTLTILTLVASAMLSLSGCTLFNKETHVTNDIQDNKIEVSGTKDDPIFSELLKSGRLLQVAAIYFDTDSSTIKSDYSNLINKTRIALSHNPELSVYIHGHADSTGESNYNKELSESRALAILTSLGLSKETHRRINVDFFGENQPLCDNDTSEGLSCNRRVDIYIIK